jgi:serine protease Do
VIRGAALPCLALAALAAAGCEQPIGPGVDAGPAPSLPSAAPAPAADRLPAFEELYSRVSPAVVDVLARQAMPFLEADRPGFPAVHGMGSGFLLDAEGHVVTSASVVQDAEEILLALPSGRELRARLCALDAGTDLAVLQVELPPGAPPLPAPLPLERASVPRAGDWVVAIGSPYGLGHTLTAGVVSSVLSPAETQAGHGLLLTDAAVNPGSNGGPLIDERGRVVGVLHLPGLEVDGLGRAIPLRDAWPILEELRAGRTPRRAWLGVRTQFVSHELARAFGLPAAQGALVSQLEPGSPAARAGLQKGDVLLQLGAFPIEDPEALVEALRRSRPGGPVKLELLREGKPLSLTITPRPEP